MSVFFWVLYDGCLGSPVESLKQNSGCWMVHVRLSGASVGCGPLPPSSTQFYYCVMYLSLISKYYGRFGPSPAVRRNSWLW